MSCLLEVWQLRPFTETEKGIEEEQCVKMVSRFVSRNLRFLYVTECQRKAGRPQRRNASSHWEQGPLHNPYQPTALWHPAQERTRASILLEFHMSNF